MTPDLRTRYLGLDLRSPIVASSTPLTGDPSFVQRLEDGRRRGGRPALAVRGGDPQRGDRARPRALEPGHRAVRRGARLLPRPSTTFKGVGDQYLARLEKTKTAVSIPVIASLNAATDRRLGPLCAADAGRRGRRPGAQPVPRGRGPAHDGRRTGRQADIELIAAEVRAAVTIPLAVKLSPYYSALANFAGRAVGGRGRRPRAVQPLLPAGPRPRHVRRRQQGRAVSHPSELRHAAPLDRDPAAAAGRRRGPRGHVRHPRRAPTRSRRSSVGADVVMMASAILRHGAEHVGTVDATSWSTGWRSASTSPSRSCGAPPERATVADPTAFERANYLATLHSWTAPPELAGV